MCFRSIHFKDQGIFLDWLGVQHGVCVRVRVCVCACVCTLLSVVQHSVCVMMIYSFPCSAGCLSILGVESPYLRLVTIPYLAQCMFSSISPHCVLLSSYSAPDNSSETSDIYSEYLSTHLQDRCPLATTKSKQWT